MKNRPRICLIHLAIIPSRLVIPSRLLKRNYVGAEESGGPHSSSDRDGRIYHFAIPVLQKTWNLVISRRSRAGMAEKCTKKRDALAELLYC